MPTLKCLARYKSRKGEFQAGQEFEASEAEAAFYLADAPGSFEVVAGETQDAGQRASVPGKGIATPTVDKMVKVPNQAKIDEKMGSPGLPPSTRQAVTDPGAFTVAELKALDLALEEWKLMLRAERRDKNRATAVTLIEEKIRELEA